MISHKLLTALALLAQHGTALDGVSGTTSRRLDDLCAPASTSAARRARTATVTVTATQGSAASSATGRVAVRGADGRADRAGLARHGVEITFLQNPGPLQTESKSGAASAPYWLRYGILVDRTHRRGASPWALRRVACSRAAPEAPAHK